MLVSEHFGDPAPAISDDEAAAVEHALAVYAEHPKGSTPRQINKMMTKLALAYPNAKLSIAEAEARIELYSEMLADIDLDVLGAGFAAAVKSSKFFPSVSELRAFALAQRAPARMIEQHRLRLLLASYRAQGAAVEVATPEQVEQVKRELGQVAESLAA